MRGRAVLEAVSKGLERDPKTIPPIERGEPMPPEAQAVVDLLRVLLKATAGRHGVAPKLIATSDELEEIARSDDIDVPVMRGWRRKLFGDDALALKRGELALVIKKGEVTVLPADQPKNERKQQDHDVAREPAETEAHAGKGQETHDRDKGGDPNSVARHLRDFSFRLSMRIFTVARTSSGSASRASSMVFNSARSPWI
jgi:hypothetical protein